MLKLVKYIFIVIFLTNIHIALSQELRNVHKTQIPANTQAFKIPHKNIIPGTIKITFHDGSKLSNTLYTVDYAVREITLKKKYPVSLNLEYRIFASPIEPYSLHAPPANNLKPLKIEPNLNDEDEPVPEQNSTIKKSGIISRGLSVGTNSDPGLNSEMNLQLSGKLSNGLFLNASLSDDNIPIQPDGTTQNIRELDNIYIEVKNKKHNLSAGDISVDNSIGKFLKSEKKVKGFQYKYLKSQDSAFALQVNTAIEKGKFKRMKFNAIDGNQGPYRLQGKNNENLIIILAGSERVFVDGKQIERGEDKDYTINYNTAELTFTTRFPVYRNNRILVEFEYSERNYTRLMGGLNLRKKLKNTKLHIGILAEKDINGQNLTEILDDSLKNILRNAGDDPQKAIITSAKRIDSIDANRIAYRKIDTLVSNTQYTDIYVYTENKTKNDYYVEFAYMGENKGNYIRTATDVNGKIYKWVAPVNGKLQGSYSPVKQLQSPDNKYFVEIGGESLLGANHTIKYDFAMSNNDQNLFSDLDDDDNSGYAFHTQTLSKSDSCKGYVLGLHTDYLHTSANFNAFENFHSPEFERDYNINFVNKNNAMNLATAKLFLDAKKNKISISGNYLKISNKITGKNYTAEYNYNGAKFKTEHKISYLNTVSENQKSSFLRYKSRLVFLLKKHVLEVSNEGERNVFSANDILDSASYRYNTFAVSLKSNGDVLLPFAVSLSKRENFDNEGNSLDYVGKHLDLKIDLTPLHSEHQNLKINFNFANSTGKHDTISENKIENYPSGSINYDCNFFNKALIFNSLVEHRMGQRMKRDFKYFQVATGQGNYVWKDFNNNNIAEINEFVTAVFPSEANYIKMQLPTEEYTPVYEQKIDISLAFFPARLFENSNNKLHEIITPFSLQNYFSNNRAYSANYKLFPTYIPDSLIFEQQQKLSSKLFFSPASRLFNFMYAYENSQNDISQVNGVSTQSTNNHTVGVNLFFAKITISPSMLIGKDDYFIEIPKNSNYNIYKQEYNLKAILNLFDKFDVSPFVIYKCNFNDLGDEQLTQYATGINLKMNELNNNIFETELKYVNNTFIGDDKTSIAYKMMSGLKHGNNFQWTVNWTIKLSKYFEINLLYSGRKSDNTKIIHSGNLAVRAIF